MNLCTLTDIGPLRMRLQLVFYLLGLLTMLTVWSTVTGRECPYGELVRRKCIYRQRHIKSINGLDIPHDCQLLDLSNNMLSSVDDFVFVHLADLLSLDLSDNNITRLGAKAFVGISNLTCLNLANNPISYVDYQEQVFRPLLNLKVLDIGPGDSDEVTYPDLALSFLVSLEQLYMDMYRDLEFGPGFARLHQLKTLSAVGHYCFMKLLNGTFQVFENSGVSSLNLAKCKISDIEPMVFAPFHHLKILNIADNKIGLTAAMDSLAGLTGRNLTFIDISKVNTEHSPPSDLSLTKKNFIYLKEICVKSLDLSKNMLIHFDPSVLLMFRHPECLEKFRLKNFYLTRHTVFTLYLYINTFLNLRALDVTGSLLRQNKRHSRGIIKTTTAPPAAAFGTSTSQYIRMPSQLEFLNISHVRLTCGGARTFVVGGRQLHTADVSYMGGTGCLSIRWHGLENVQVLNISGNDYSIDLTHVFFYSFPNLTTLVARDTNLVVPFKADTVGLLFRNLVRLKHLDLANSGLTNIPQALLPGKSELVSLDLSYNKLTKIPTVIFSLQSLEHLDMRFNVLTNIPPSERRFLDTLVKERGEFSLFMGGNPFSCNCETFDFVEWIWTSNIRFDNNGNYSCVLNNGSELSMLKLSPILKDLRIQCVSSFWIVFGALGAAVLIVCLLGAAVGYRYRVPITYWCITFCRKPEVKPEQRHTYDALVAYCHEDYEWVCHTLQPTLEKNESQFDYKLCFNDRDFMPGQTIEENVVNAINSSLKTILVITPAFVRSAWCRFEVQMARMKMIQEGREDVVIPVILQDVPVSTMPKALLNLWNTSVFLIWSESPAEQRHFWDKLTSALGPARVRRQGHFRDEEDRELEDIPEREDRRPLL